MLKQSSTWWRFLHQDSRGGGVQMPRQLADTWPTVGVDWAITDHQLAVSGSLLSVTSGPTWRRSPAHLIDLAPMDWLIQERVEGCYRSLLSGFRFRSYQILRVKFEIKCWCEMEETNYLLSWLHLLYTFFNWFQIFLVSRFLVVSFVVWHAITFFSLIDMKIFLSGNFGNQVNCRADSDMLYAWRTPSGTFDFNACSTSLMEVAHKT